ncbi:chromosome partitioning protein [Agromyces sp. G08B096]|uniref:Chromosome partitioning protein n=1 Tax=Agromyces sp. G08B096 TaxID=3156399 RepID=A0AAU7W7T5_9MICO
MTTTPSQATVYLRSSTAAEVHLDGEIEHLMAANGDALRDRVVEAVRLLAASAGHPVTATLVEGSSRWPLVVHPDGTVAEPAPPAPEPLPADQLGFASPTGGAGLPPLPGAPVPAAAPVAAPPVSAVAPPVAAAAAPAPAAPVAAAPVADPVPAGRPVASAAPKPTVDDLLNSRSRPRRDRATTGWRGAVRRATGGVISPTPSRAERSRLERERKVQRRLDGSRTIVILNPKGGAHKTTSTLLLAATFGTLRGGSTLAWDNNETRGTLGWRAQHAPHHRTAVDLLEDLDSFADAGSASLARLDAYVRTQVDARFDVLASDEDAAASSTIDAAAFDRLHAMLARYYRLILIDTGNNMRASNWVASVAAADQLVIVSTVREDTAASAAWLLDGLREKGFGQKVDEAVTILAAPSAKPDPRLTDRLESHFSQVTSAVTQVPFDPALVDGGPIDFDALSEETRDAWLSAAAVIAERL